MIMYGDCGEIELVECDQIGFEAIIQCHSFEAVLAFESYLCSIGQNEQCQIQYGTVVQLT